MKVILFLAAVLVSACAHGASFPKVFVEYGSDIDAQSCFKCDARVLTCQKIPIPPAVTWEAVVAVPKLQALWTTNEASLLGGVVDIVGKPFSRLEETVSAVTCPYLKGEAQPILIPIANFLNSTTGGHPYDTQFFVGLTMHELLHRYVDTVLGGFTPDTPMLEKYSNENLLVRRHLHVDALQKAVYVRLGRVAEINAIITSDSTYFGADYKRAWEIVNLEGVDPFINELKKH